jgi:uncharacterized protein YbjT (DUF2867 family)
MKNKKEFNVIIFGATGMVGIEVWYQCINHSQIKRVVAVARRPTGVKHLKLEEIEHQNFLDYSALEPVFPDLDICLYCIGVYRGKVATAKFLEITCDYLAHLIDSIETMKQDITFCLFSAQGADPTERSPFLFAKAKGRAEKKLSCSKISRKFIFRPGFINPGIKQPRSRIPAWMVKPFYKLIPGIDVDSSALASVMVDVGLNGNEQAILENRDIRNRARIISEQ